MRLFLWMRLFFIDICHCAYPKKMLTVRKIPIFRTLLRYFTSSGSWFHLLVENCKMMVACPHHPGFLSHNVPITITRLSSRNKSSSENQRWKWNVRKFSQNGLTKNKWKESGNVLSGNTGEEKREARKFKMMMLLLLLTFWTILSSGVECFFKAKKCWSLTKTNCLLITITMGILPPTMDTEFCLHLQLH